MFVDGRAKQNIIVYYKAWNAGYERAVADGLFRRDCCYNYLPTCDDIIKKTKEFRDKGGSFCIIDDFAMDINKETAELFTVVAGHWNVIICLLVQHLFPKNPCFRELSLNTTYIVMFKCIRFVCIVTIPAAGT